MDERTSNPRQRDKRPLKPGSSNNIMGIEVTAGRVPPQNIEAETSLIGSLLIEKDAIIKIADMVTADDFYVDRHAIIFAAMTDLYESRQPIDVVSLSGKLRDAGELEHVGGATYITELTSTVPTAAHVVH